MADFCDLASATEALHREAALSRAKTKSEGQGPVWIDGEAHCRECGEEIPKRRMQAVPGVGLCVECAE